MNDYIERFKAMVEQLKQNPNIEIETFKVFPPMTQKGLDMIQQEAKLSQDMIDFYAQANGLELKWKGKDSFEECCGSIDILPIGYTMSDWRDEIYFDDDDELKPLHPMDHFTPEACAAFYVDKGATPAKVKPTIYYNYCGEEMVDLEISFGEYLELLLKSRGFWYWQKTIITARSGVEWTMEPKNFRKYMPLLFDDYDHRDFYHDQEIYEDLVKEEAERIKQYGR